MQAITNPDALELLDCENLFDFKISSPEALRKWQQKKTGNR